MIPAFSGKAAPPLPRIAQNQGRKSALPAEKSPRRGRPPKPGTLRLGRAAVAIRRDAQGRWLADWRHDGRRTRRFFTGRHEAEAFAKSVLPELAAAKAAAALPHEADELADLRAVAERHGRHPRAALAELDAALCELSKAPGLSLLSACRLAVAAAVEVAEPLTLAELCDRFRAERAAAGVSAAHAGKLAQHLARLVAAHPCLMAHDLTAPRLQAHLDAIGGGPWNRRNHRTTLAAMLRWGVKRRHLPKAALAELDALSAPRVRPAAVALPTAADLRELLLAVQARRPELLPAVALMAFSGIRTNEVLRLRWCDVTAESVVIGATAAKTASRRVVPLPDAARAWLAVAPRGHAERICPCASDTLLSRRLRLAVAAERAARGDARPVVWPKNGLRHAALTHRLALTGDAARVALDAGNSPAMVLRHYRELSTRAEAERWFAVTPPSQPVNVIPLAA